MGIYQIAIDGPSGSGKSTLAKEVSAALGIMYLDTGAMYRTCALAAIRHGVDPRDEDAVTKLLREIEVEVRFIEKTQHMILDGEDVSALIRTGEVSMAASAISALPVVRKAMVDMQRKIASEESFVLDGRDIASNVLPDCKYKFFFTASAEVRAQRRLAELVARGDNSQTYEEVLHDIIQRDKQDSERASAPLVKVPDAIEVDTTTAGIEQTRDFILSFIRED